MPVPAVYDPANFAGRVDYAAACIANSRCLTTRTFDTCFEMFDADAVITALVRRAAKNDRLRQGIEKMWSGSWPAHWTMIAERHAAIPTAKLHELSRQLIDGENNRTRAAVERTSAANVAEGDEEAAVTP